EVALDEPVAAAAAAPVRGRRHWLVVGSVAAIAVAGSVALVVALSRSSPKTAGPPPLRSGAYVPTLQKAPCPGTFIKQVPNGTCGGLAVPEDRTKPHGRWLQLLVTSAPALGASPAADPTIRLSRSGAAPAIAPERDHAEVITIETRLSFDPNAAMACPE